MPGLITFRRGTLSYPDLPRSSIASTMVLGREYHCTTGCTWLLEKFHGIKLHAADVHMSKPTADWERVGDRFYRKIQVYTDVFDIDLELEHYDVSGAPFGGALGEDHAPS